MVGINIHKSYYLKTDNPLKIETMFDELNNWKNWHWIELVVFVAVIFLAATQIFDAIISLFK